MRLIQIDLRSWIVSLGSRIINWVFPGQGGRIAYKIALAFITRLRALYKRRGIVQGTAVIWPRPGHVVTESFEWIRPCRILKFLILFILDILDQEKW